jgi:hypothetical protein
MEIKMNRSLEFYYVHTNKQLSGVIYNDPRFADGEYITTTPVVSMSDDGAYVITRSGTQYYLGEKCKSSKEDLRELLK